MVYWSQKKSSSEDREKVVEYGELVGRRLSQTMLVLV